MIRLGTITRAWLAAALYGALILISSALAQQTSGDRSFLRCGGWACSLTATKLSGVNSESAWALGRTTKADAENDCGGREGQDFKDCVAEQTARPPVVITANCEKGTASF